jgi:hypothetical protein
LAGFAAFGPTQINAGCAGAGFAQPWEAPSAFVAIGPINFEALAFGEQNTHFVRSDGDSGKRAFNFVLAALLFLAEEAYAFVAHEYSLQRAANGGRFAALTFSDIVAALWPVRVAPYVLIAEN